MRFTTILAKNYIWLGFLLGSIPFASHAQSRLDVAGVALGRSTVASARGLNAITTNPAGLALQSTNGVSFTIMPFAAVAGNSMMNVKDFNYYFGGDGTKDEEGNANPRTLTEEETNTFADMIDAGRIAVSAEIMPIGIMFHHESFGALGFSVTSTVQSATQLPDNFGNFLKGNVGRQSLVLNNSSVGGIRYSAYQMHYARSFFKSEPKDAIAEFSLGATAKLIHGYSYLESNKASYVKITPFTPVGWDSTQSWAVDMNYSNRSAGLKQDINNFQVASVFGFGDASGTGFGADVGAVMTFRTKETEATALALGISLMDAGIINWNNDLEQYSLIVADTVAGVAQMSDEQLNKYDGIRTEASSFTTQLPMHLRFGGAAYLQNLFSSFALPAVISFEYSQGLNSIGANTTDPRGAIGIEFICSGWFPSIRSGLQMGGIQGFQWSGGFGWNDASGADIDISLGNMSLLNGLGGVSWVDAALRIQGNIPF